MIFWITLKRYLKSWLSTKSACRFHGGTKKSSTTLHSRTLPYSSSSQRKFTGSQSTTSPKYSSSSWPKLHRTLRTYLTSRTTWRSPISSRGMKILPQKASLSSCINGPYGGIITTSRTGMGSWPCWVWLMRAAALIATFGMNCSLQDCCLGKTAKSVTQSAMVSYAPVTYEKLSMSWILILLWRSIS